MQDKMYQYILDIIALKDGSLINSSKFRNEFNNTYNYNISDFFIKNFGKIADMCLVYNV